MNVALRLMRQAGVSPTLVACIVHVCMYVCLWPLCYQGHGAIDDSRDSAHSEA